MKAMVENKLAREVVASISLSALRHNLQRVKLLAKNAQVYAVVKANGYGHGIDAIAQGLNEADAFAVALPEEAIALRKAGITQPILLLEGVFNPEQMALAEQYQLQIVVHRLEQWQWLIAHPGKQKPSFWLKLNSGMNRLGLSKSDLEGCLRQLEGQHSSDFSEQCLGLLSHFACADEPEQAMNEQQWQCLHQLAQGYQRPVCCANSAAILSLPYSHQAWVRPGIMLYGSSPFTDQTATDLQLEAVMQLQARVISVQSVAAGDGVGYGSSWKAGESSRVALVGIGYGDGYPRHAPSGTPVAIAGKRAGLVGRVSMDMLAIDVTAMADVRVGDVVELWGNQVPVDEVAKAAGTISYELLCGLSQRVARQTVA